MTQALHIVGTRPVFTSIKHRPVNGRDGIEYCYRMLLDSAKKLFSIFYSAGDKRFNTTEPRRECAVYNIHQPSRLCLRPQHIAVLQIKHPARGCQIASHAVMGVEQPNRVAGWPGG